MAFIPTNVTTQESSKAAQSQGISLPAFLASLAVSALVFALFTGLFFILRNRITKIYVPRTYLVPEQERTEAPPSGLFKWILPVFQISNKHFIEKCGLDAYFFLRYLRTLLRIFVPLALLILPILLPINAVGGKGTKPVPNNQSQKYNVTGLDTLAWGNVAPEKTNRYWAHLILAVVVVVWVCYVSFDELKHYIKVRQSYLTSPQHRLHKSAKTVLITAIPTHLLSEGALYALFDLFPGGLLKIWINRDFDKLKEKVERRDKLSGALESAELHLIQKAREGHAKIKAEEAQDVKMQKDQPGLAAKKNRLLAERASIRKEVQLRRAKKEAERQNGDNSVELETRKSVVSTDSHQATNDRGYYDLSDDSDNDDGKPVWELYVKEKDRDTMRLPIFGWQWMPSLPLLGKKVDTIYYCRKEVARLNFEIEQEQQSPEKYPVMNSAFVQFRYQVAAHMACQAVTYHDPKQMTPKSIEVAPGDVIWDNMSIKWWENYVRTFLVLAAVSGMVILWTFPVAFTGVLSQVDYLRTFTWLSWITKLPKPLLSLLQGVLPGALIAGLMALVPILLRFLAKLQGNRTGTRVELSVQNYFFAFLFVQVFLVVSISSGFIAAFQSIRQNPTSIANVLAQNLPRASNYFFSYMLLQAFSVSSGALLQIPSLLGLFIFGPLNDSTPRQKWIRRNQLPEIRWGSFFPVYTNLAAIGLVYSIVSPLILVFNIMTFSLFWVVYRYNTLYVTEFKYDTLGLLFPRAINQLFVGLYVMEICLVGLFFLVRDEDNNLNCKTQGIIMIVLVVATVVYQFLLNEAFAPLVTYLPINLENGAQWHDDEVAREQQEDRQAVTSQRSTNSASSSVERKREADLHLAFQHESLRAKRPIIWLPNDELGVSDDEVRRTKKVSRRIWMSNEGALLDKKGRVMYTADPPDYKEGEDPIKL
ncbi:MAG: hypothetical protein M1835_003368 [Candelina submexicana]|nr:MAG: hypothetical protein M1835_003368 [Candelina submexicana]